MRRGASSKGKTRLGGKTDGAVGEATTGGNGIGEEEINGGTKRCIEV